MIFSKPVFQLWPEVPDKTLDWPSSAVSQSADGVALNLFAQFPNHINLLWLRVAWPVQGLIRHFRPELENRFAEYHARAA